MPIAPSVASFPLCRPFGDNVSSVDGQVVGGAVGAGARSAAIKLHSLCEPSQNGLFLEWPQRQRAIAGLPAGMVKALPAASTTVNGPSTNSGPLSRIRIVTCDMRGAPG